MLLLITIQSVKIYELPNLDKPEKDQVVRIKYQDYLHYVTNNLPKEYEYYLLSG